MPVIKYAKILQELMEKPFFTARDLAIRGVNPGYIKRLANHLKSKGKIYIVEKGKYAVTDNPFLIAPFITFPSYISMFSALFLHDVISQIPFSIQVVTTRKRKNKIITFNDTKIEFFKIKKELFFGFEYIWHENYQIPVAKPEKAIIDILYFGLDIQGFEIDFDEIDCNILKDYAFETENKSLIKKLQRRVEC